METGTAVSIKTIQRKFTIEFCLKSCKPAGKPRLNQAMKKKHLDLAKRYASWDIEIKVEIFSVKESTLILVFYDCTVHSCFANFYFLWD